MNTKVCSTCDTEKPLSAYYKYKTSKDGRMSTCKECKKAYQQSYYSKNSQAERDKVRLWKSNNKDAYQSYLKTYQQNNLSKYRGYYNKRRAAKVNALPEWLSEDHKKQIADVYAHAQECEMLTGDKYHVDHIVPLQGKNISGLHVPWNLQVLPADINISKSNKY